MAIPRNLTGQQLYNFIGGRRAYNSSRQWLATQRRWRIIFYWAEHPHMSKADLARHFGVSRATITRDLQAIKREHHRYRNCPVCGGLLDTGPDIGTVMQVISDLKRQLPPVFEGLGIGSRF